MPGDAPALPPPETQVDEETLTKLLPPYRVILHNDDVNSMEHVVDALLKSVPTLSEQDAVRVMMDAHTEGRAVVTICPLETAEFYRDRLQSFSLGASIESA
ncbi:MAG: ATP-dependent Clp protease adaptor ClpS [Chloroflexi bacterium]|nr:ATP-dependent Clp protease adaptor ClpS [Chloroflexota bacterium]